MNELITFHTLYGKYESIISDNIECGFISNINYIEKHKNYYIYILLLFIISDIESILISLHSSIVKIYLVMLLFLILIILFIDILFIIYIIIYSFIYLFCYFFIIIIILSIK
jgi:NADH:ubiquinone oxidoreductase subunit 3 (subunit A)